MDSLLHASASTIRRSALHILHVALQRSGAAKSYVLATHIDGATILMYHSVASDCDAQWIDPRHRIDPETFEEQMDFLARRRRVVSMTSLITSLRAGRATPAGTTVITFDDGYIDNLTIAAPILNRLGLPATLYLPTGYIERGETQWVDRLHTMLRTRTRHRLRLPDDFPPRTVNGTVKPKSGSTRAARPVSWKLLPRTVYDLQRRAESSAARREVNRRLIAATWEQREALLNLLEEQLAPTEQPPRMTMTWDEVRYLRHMCPRMEIGVHTRDHIDLTSRTVPEAQAEVRACIDDYQRELGREPTHFSCPYGRCNAATRDLIAEAGLFSAVAWGEEYLIGLRSDCYTLNRITPPSSIARLGFMTSGAYPQMARALVGRA